MNNAKKSNSIRDLNNASASSLPLMPPYLLSPSAITVELDPEASGKEIELSRTSTQVVKRGTFNGKQVVIKSLIIPMDRIVASTATCDLALAEARKLNSQNFRKLAKFIGVVLETCSIVTEYMPDGSLRDYILEKPELSWSSKFLIAIDVSDAMSFLHARQAAGNIKKDRLLHQNLHSGNVLLCMENRILRAKVTDYGVKGKMRERAILLLYLYIDTKHTLSLSISSSQKGFKDSFLKPLSTEESEVATQDEKGGVGGKKKNGLMTSFTRAMHIGEHEQNNHGGDERLNVSLLKHSNNNNNNSSHKRGKSASKISINVFRAPETFLISKKMQFMRESDVYSFGVVLLEIATWKPAEVVIDSYVKAMDRANVPYKMSSAVKSCLNIDSTRRPHFVDISPYLAAGSGAIQGGGGNGSGTASPQISSSPSSSFEEANNGGVPRKKSISSPAGGSVGGGFQRPIEDFKINFVRKGTAGSGTGVGGAGGSNAAGMITGSSPLSNNNAGSSQQEIPITLPTNVLKSPPRSDILIETSPKRKPKKVLTPRAQALKQKRKRILTALLVVVLLIIAIGVAVGITVGGGNSSSNGNVSGGGGNTAADPSNNT